MHDQLPLQFPSAAAPLQHPAEVELLVTYLLENPGFHFRKDITTAIGLDERQIRQAAELSDGYIVSGPGSPGYCHISHCPLEKLNHIRKATRSQARHMLNKYLKLGKRAHEAIH